MKVIKTLATACGLCLLSGPAVLANEPADPVRVLMDMAGYNAGVEPNAKAVYDDYFSAGMLLNYFSQGFVEAYGAALLASKRAHDNMLLDYDPVIGGQDGCVPKDVVYGKPQVKGAATEVLVGFKRNWCYDGEYEGKDEVTEVIYRLVQEDDEVGEKRYVIDDIHFVNDVPLRGELEALAK
jgi:hypothetical protein